MLVVRSTTIINYCYYARKNKLRVANRFYYHAEEDGGGGRREEDDDEDGLVAVQARSSY